MKEHLEFAKKIYEEMTARGYVGVGYCSPQELFYSESTAPDVGAMFVANTWRAGDAQRVIAAMLLEMARQNDSSPWIALAGVAAFFEEPKTAEENRLADRIVKIARQLEGRQ